MNILIISRGVPTESNPQWGNFEKEQALALKDYGHNIVLMSITRQMRFNFKLSIHEIEGIKAYDLSVPSFFFSTRLIFSIGLLQRLAIWLYKQISSNGFRCDIIYSHYLSNSIIGLGIKKKYNLPLVAIEHWSKMYNEKLPYYIGYMGRKVYVQADMLITVSDYLRRRLNEHFNRDAIVVNNMAACDFKIPMHHKTSETSFHFISVGSLIKRKGYDILIKAFSCMCKNRNVSLSIVGSGPEQPLLQTMINDLGLQSQVHLLGAKTKAEIVGILQTADAFVLASRSETFGVVYIEAMMMGLPVIGTICGGPEEFINESNGLLIEVDDVEGLSLALERMIENINSYDRIQIAADCRKRFSPEVIAKQLTECFELVLSKYN